LLARRSVEADDEAARILGDLLSSHASPRTEIVVFWANLLVPTIALPAKAVGEHADEVLATSHDVWVFVPETQVFLEYWHGGVITAARVPDRDN
jgi:hypothetical protein